MQTRRWFRKGWVCGSVFNCTSPQRLDSTFDEPDFPRHPRGAKQIRPVRDALNICTAGKAAPARHQVAPSPAGEAAAAPVTHRLLTAPSTDKQRPPRRTSPPQARGKRRKGACGAGGGSGLTSAVPRDLQSQGIGRGGRGHCWPRQRGSEPAVGSPPQDGAWEQSGCHHPNRALWQQGPPVPEHPAHLGTLTPCQVPSPQAGGLCRANPAPSSPQHQGSRWGMPGVPCATPLSPKHSRKVAGTGTKTQNPLLGDGGFRLPLTKARRPHGAPRVPSARSQPRLASSPAVTAAP